MWRWEEPVGVCGPSVEGCRGGRSLLGCVVLVWKGCRGGRSLLGNVVLMLLRESSGGDSSRGC